MRGVTRLHSVGCKGSPLEMHCYRHNYTSPGGGLKKLHTHLMLCTFPWISERESSRRSVSIYQVLKQYPRGFPSRLSGRKNLKRDQLGSTSIIRHNSSREATTFLRVRLRTSERLPSLKYRGDRKLHSLHLNQNDIKTCTD
jgi:hypothetical protein